MQWTIYSITNSVNGKQYVGQTSKTLDVRWKQHCIAANSKTQYAIHQAIKKHGAAVFELKVLDTAQNLSEAHEKEREWILKLQTYSVGYNQTKGGDGEFHGCSHSEATKKLISSKLTGRMMTTDHRKRISQALIGNHASQETKKKLSVNRGERSSAGKFYQINSSAGSLVVKSLFNFCRENGICYQTLYTTIRRKVPTRTGWLAVRV